MLIMILKDFALIFLPLLVVLDPAGTIPLFLALTDQRSEHARRLIARRATFVAIAVGVLFVVIGQTVFSFLGVTFADFQIAGGLLLVVLAILDLLSRGKPTVDQRSLEKLADDTSDLESISVVPLAVPLIVGPATLTTSLLLVSTYSPKYREMVGPVVGPLLVMGMVSVALVLNLLLMFLAMWNATLLERVVGRGTMQVINKIVMILLAAIAVSLIRKGITSIVAGHA